MRMEDGIIVTTKDVCDPGFVPVEIGQPISLRSVRLKF